MTFLVILFFCIHCYKPGFEKKFNFFDWQGRITQSTTVLNQWWVIPTTLKGSECNLVTNLFFRTFNPAYVSNRHFPPVTDRGAGYSDQPLCGVLVIKNTGVLVLNINEFKFYRLCSWYFSSILCSEDFAPCFIMV